MIFDLLVDSLRKSRTSISVNCTRLLELTLEFRESMFFQGYTRSEFSASLVGVRAFLSHISTASKANFRCSFPATE